MNHLFTSPLAGFPHCFFSPSHRFLLHSAQFLHHSQHSITFFIRRDFPNINKEDTRPLCLHKETPDINFILIILFPLINVFCSGGENMLLILINLPLIFNELFLFHGYMIFNRSLAGREDGQRRRW